MLKFLQINLNHCRAAQDLMLQTEREHHMDMTLITEPYRVPTDSMWISNENDTACIHWNLNGHMSTCIKKKQGRFSTMVQSRDLVISGYMSPNVDNCVFEEFLDELDNNVTDTQD